MSKPKVTPTEFPVTIEGKLNWVKKGDYTKCVSSQATIKFGVEVKRDHISQMLEAVEGGKTEMTGDAPDEFHKVFAGVLKDFNTAVEEVERKAKEEADKEAAEKAKKEEADKAELALFEKSKTLSTDFTSLSEAFDTGGDAMDRFVAKNGATDDDLLAAFKASLKMGEFTSWMKGDLVVQLEDRGHINVCTRIAEDMGVPFPSIYRMARTARTVPPERRVKGVNFTTYSEIANAKLDAKPEEAKKKLEVLLKAADEGKISKTPDVRAAVKLAQGKTPEPEKLPEEDPKREFYVVDLEAESGDEIRSVKGFPKEEYENGAIVIDVKTGTRFAENGFRKEASKRWVELPVIEREAPETEAEKKAREAKEKKEAEAAAKAAAKKGKKSKVAA